MAEHSDKVCMDCGTQLTVYYPKEIENFILIKNDEYSRNEPTYRCNQCGMIYQFDYSQMIVKGETKKLLVVFCFQIEKGVEEHG